jgi:acyl-CoA synthetase (NDP forming)
MARRPQLKDRRTTDPVIDRERVRTLFAGVRAQGRTSLLEPEGYELLRCAGIPVAPHQFVRDAAEAASLDLGALPGRRLVVKVASAGIAHKTELGGVVVVPRRRDAVVGAIRAMAARLGAGPAGYTVASFVEHEPSIRGELLASLRWTDDFGPIVTVGAGGTDADAIARHLRPGSRVAVVSPTATPRETLPDRLAASLGVELATAALRGLPPRLAMERLVDVVERLFALAPLCRPDELLELEINPFAITPEGPVALDVLATLGSGRLDLRPDRPIAEIRRLLEPKTIAIVGVSSRMNPGRIILRNLLRDGFDPDRVRVVKPGVDEIDGCRCVPTLGSLPEKVDLLVVAVSAADAPGIVCEAIDTDAAASLIVIPGGLEEKQGTGDLVGRMHHSLAAARARGGGPLVNGPNCLGIRSRPGRYDTLFIPTAKLAGPSGPADPVAILAQSGAFAISRLSRLRGIEPRYVITVGNQMDLTIGDHLEHLADDPSIDLVAVYVEGFAPLDGLRFLRAARAMTDAGRSVLLYRAGRTRAGAVASASHTASIAGDALVARSLAEAAGVAVADTVQEFDGLLSAFARLRGRPAPGPRLGAVTNAGFECVAIADNLGPFSLASFSAPTLGRLGDVMADRAIDGVVDVHNPLDLTPMADDAAYEAVVRAVLDDAGVDLGIVGVVPLSVEIETLVAGGDHDEDVTAPDAIAARLARLWAGSTKPWVTVVDAGSRYDVLAGLLEDAGLPVFRTGDAAMWALARWFEGRRGR